MKADPIKEMERSVLCLALELEPDVYMDVRAHWDKVLTEVMALRALIRNARAETRQDTEWFCPTDLEWTSCPGDAEECMHDQTRTVTRHTLTWKCESREQSEVLQRAQREWGTNEIYSHPAGEGP